MKRVLRTAILAGPILLLIQAVAAGVLLRSIPAPQGGSLGLALVSTLSTALVLVGLGLRLDVRGVRRVGILGLVAAGIPLINLLEALFFSLDIPPEPLGALFLNALVVGVLFALALEGLLGPACAAGTRPSPSRPAGGWAIRIGACALLYVVFYFAAGYWVWPFVRSFYEARPMPDSRLVILMQIFRGLVFTSVALALARFLAASRAGAALAVGLTFSLIGGVLPLLLPNPYMPDFIRFPHMIETSVSNFLFGCLAGWLLGRSEAAPSPVSAAA
jgi:hypothetical protein